MKKASSIVLALVLALGLLPGLFGCGGAPAEEAAPGAPAEETTPAEEAAPGVAAGPVDLARSWKEAYAKGQSELDWFKEECARLRGEMKDLKPITMKVWDEGAIGGDWDALWLAIKRIIETESDGKITMEWYPASILYNSAEAARALSTGALDCVVRSIMVNMINIYGSCRADYFQLTDEGDMAWAFSDLGNDFNNWDWAYPGLNAYAMAPVGSGGDGDGCSTKPVYKYEDLKGLSCTTWGSATSTKVYESMGMVGNPAPSSEHWMAMYQGSLDVMWGKGVRAIIDDKLYQVCPYFWNAPRYPAPSSTKEITGYPWYNFQFTVNRDWFLALPRPYQDFIRLIINEECEFHTLNTHAQQEIVKWRLVNELGMEDLAIRFKIPKVDQAYIEAQQKITREWVAKYCDGPGAKKFTSIDPRWQPGEGTKILEEMIQFRAVECEKPENTAKFLPWYGRVISLYKAMVAEGQARAKAAKAAGEDPEKVWQFIEIRRVMYDPKYQDYDVLLNEIVSVTSHIAGEKPFLKRYGLPDFLP